MKSYIIENGVLIEYKGNANHAVIPNGVTEIYAWAFYGCDTITSIKIPNSVTKIGNSAFHCCGLTSLEIPISVTEIGAYAFSNCVNLENIEIPNSVTSIGTAAFRSCESLRSIKIPSKVTRIKDFTFEGCRSLESIEIPNSVILIEDYAFNSCTNLTNITIPNSVISIGTAAFRSCIRLESINIPSSVTRIDDEAFKGLYQTKPQYKSNGALRAFKAFNKDWTCRDFQYEVGKSYHQDGHIECCFNGFHACPNPLNVFDFYSGYLDELHFAEVELSGYMDWVDNKVAASDIRIVRELTASELADIYNSMEKV